MGNAAQQSRLAEKAMVDSLSSEQLRLVADWIREEVSLFEKEYEQAAKRVKFVADRLEAIAQNAVPEEAKTDKPWRFSDEYWKQYEANDD